MGWLFVLQVSPDGEHKCINKGCSKNYKPEDNNDTACRSAAAAVAAAAARAAPLRYCCSVLHLLEL